MQYRASSKWMWKRIWYLSHYLLNTKADGLIKSLGKCHFLPGGGAPENWGIRYFFLDQKGDQKIFSNKKGGITYIF